MNNHVLKKCTLKMLLYEIDASPRYVDVDNDKEVFKSIVGGTLEYVPVIGDLVLICNKDKQSYRRPRNLKVNRVITRPIIINGSVVVKQEPICGNFLVCQKVNDRLVDLSEKRLSEIKSIIGK